MCTPLSVFFPLARLLDLKHAVRRHRPAVVLGSQVAALGRYERVPLREESDSYNERTRISTLSIERDLICLLYVPHMSQQLQAERMRVERQTLRVNRS